MPKESISIKVAKTCGEKAIVLANKLEIVNRELEIRRNKNFIYIPLVRQLQENEFEAFKEEITDCEISTHLFSRKKQIKTFVGLLRNKLPSDLLASLPRAIDFVGDIAIVEIPSELDAYKKVIGKAVLEAHKNVQTVLAKAGTVTGTYRLRKYSVIAGKPKTETVHTEYGCKYHVDIAKAYFSPRLSYEHDRIASLVQERETVVDLFTGVGSFAILIAKTRENVNVYAIDMNPHAVEFLKKNISLNKVEGKVHPILGDARKAVKQELSGFADRVIMNLPEKAMEFVDTACETIKPTGGIVHFYSSVKLSDSLEAVTQHFRKAVKQYGREVEKILFSRLVRATAPYEWHAVLDAKIF
jgi:tRNA (guanine37-N1)-methyltransferase